MDSLDLDDRMEFQLRLENVCHPGEAYLWVQDTERKYKKAESRIDWIEGKIKEFYEERDCDRILNRIHRRNGSLEPPQDVSVDIPRKIKILDVGSCYNPFRDNLNSEECIAIDLQAVPEREVFKCDFLTVETSEGLCKVKSTNDEIKTLPVEYFDTVIFCLLLEYLPIPWMRYRVCSKARKVLKDKGQNRKQKAINL